MSYFGAYYGAVVTVSTYELADPGPDPVEVETPAAAPQLRDLVTLSLDRLCQYAKEKSE
jgi:hypothetical protein